MGIGDAEELAIWFINHMTSEQRRKLMGERPVLYMRLYPDLSVNVIVEHVTDAINAEKQDNGS